MDLHDWPDCPVPGCPNKCCLALDSIYCFPHTPGFSYIKGLKIDLRQPQSEPEEEPVR